MNCTSCNLEVSQNYCSNCGQAVRLKRIDGHYIVHEIEHVLHFEKGILYTIRELLTKPGLNVRYFLVENRSRLVKPIVFVLVSSLLYTLVNHFFHVEDKYTSYQEIKKTSVVLIFKWIQDHYGYANIIMGVFIAFWLKLLFRKTEFNLFEILILLCFVMGMSMLIFTLFGLIQGLTHVNLMGVASGVTLVYSAWATGQFFDKSKATNYVKALVSYLLGTLTFSLSAIMLGVLVDLVKLH